MLLEWLKSERRRLVQVTAAERDLLVAVIDSEKDGKYWIYVRSPNSSAATVKAGKLSFSGRSHREAIERLRERQLLTRVRADSELEEYVLLDRGQEMAKQMVSIDDDRAGYRGVDSPGC